MENHCLATFPNGLFVINQELQSFLYKFNDTKWNQIQSRFPCDNKKQSQIQCKTFKDEFIIIPSVKNGKSCTAIFDIEKTTWTQLRNDNRKAPFGGYFQMLPNDQRKNILYYYGGFEKDTKVQSQEILQFDGIEEGWYLLPIKLPEPRNHTVKMTLLHADICNI